MVKGRRGGWKAAEILVKEIKSLFGLPSDDLTDVIVQICKGLFDAAFHAH